MALARFYFYPTLFYNVVMERVSSRNWFDRIDENIILGAIPFKSMLTKLKENENVKSVISMNENYELRFGVCNDKDWSENGVKFLHLPTEDFHETPSLPFLKRGVQFIMKEINGTVYIHCKAGRTRSATMAACYMMEKYNCNPEEAVQMLKKKRPHIVLRPNNWNSIFEYYSSIQHGK